MSTVTTQSTSGLGKRAFCGTSEDEPATKIAASVQWYHVVLESESSMSSEHDTESVHSIQDKETDVARDTSDTESGSVMSDTEFEVASLSDDDEHFTAFWGDVQSESSSGTDDMLRTGMFAAICDPGASDSDLQLWPADTEGEDDLENSRSSMVGVAKQPRLLVCAQCKGTNNNPLYPYCEKCYQVRKTIFPPRPKPHRSRNQKSVTSTKEVQKPLIEPERLRSFLTSLSQDSGIGLSQDLETGDGDSNSANQLPADLALDKIIVPKELDEKSASSSASSAEPLIKSNKLGDSDMCMVCNVNPKNGIFVHGSMGHMCCCYKCAIKVWTRTKRCPVCNCKVKNVLKVFLT